MTVLHEMPYILSFHAVFEIWYMGFICTIHLSLNKPQSKDSVATQAAMLPSSKCLRNTSSNFCSVLCSLP